MRWTNGPISWRRCTKPWPTECGRVQRGFVPTNTSTFTCSEQLQCIWWNRLLICDVQIFYFNTVRNCKIKSSNLTPLSVFVFLIIVVIQVSTVNTDKDLSCELHIYFKSNTCCWICICWMHTIFSFMLSIAFYSQLPLKNDGNIHLSKLNSDIILVIFLLGSHYKFWFLWLKDHCKLLSWKTYGMRWNLY